MALHMIEAAVRDGVATKRVPAGYDELLAHILACQHHPDSTSWRTYDPPRHSALVLGLAAAAQDASVVMHQEAWATEDH